MRPRIALIAMAGRSWLGGAQYIANLSRAVRSVGAHVTLIGPSSFDRALYEELGADFDESRFGPMRPRLTELARRAAFATLGTNLEILSEILSSRATFAYPFFGGRISQTLPFAHAAWIPDLQHRHLPEMFPPAERRRRDRQFGMMARLAPTIVLSSYSAERDMHSTYPASRDRTAVLRFRSSPPLEALTRDGPAVRANYGVPGRYFFVANQFWPHKNHDVVFDALERVGNTETRTVVCTGLLAPDRRPMVVEGLRRRGLLDRVMLLGQIPRLDQLTLMRDADVVIQPSLFEGWSTVVEDARGLGVPLIASDIPVHREQTADMIDAKLFDPHNSDALAALLLGMPPRESRSRATAAPPMDTVGRRLLEIAERSAIRRR